VITFDSKKPFSEFRLADLVFDGTWSVYFDGRAIADETMQLRVWKCRVCHENQGGLSKLRKHVQQAHNLFFWYACGMRVIRV
jgi:hypothetical protein